MESEKLLCKYMYLYQENISEAISIAKQLKNKAKQHQCSNNHLGMYEQNCSHINFYWFMFYRKVVHAWIFL